MADISIKFKIRYCPLCSKKLEVRSVKINDTLMYNEYFCKEFYLRKDYDFFELLTMDGTGDYVHDQHYSIYFVYGEYKQTTIIPPFKLVTDEDGVSTMIYKYPENKFMLEIPAIFPENYLPSKLADKVKTLILFS